MKIIRSLAASAVVLSAAVTAQVQAADVTLKFGHVGKPGSLQSMGPVVVGMLTRPLEHCMYGLS